MGVLLENAFWAKALNEMVTLQPVLGQTITAENEQKLYELCCSSLGHLLNDPDFSGDLNKAINNAVEAKLIDEVVSPDFADFLEKFLELENKILQDAGVDSIASRDIAREVREVAKRPITARLDQLEEKIKFCRTLACDPQSASQGHRMPLWKAVSMGFKGVGLMGIDTAAAGGAVLLGPIGGAAAATVVGVSAGYGAMMIGKALEDRW